MSEHRSDKQIETSRANGAKSRGPVTPSGKNRSSANSFKHGRYAITTPLLRGEDSAAFQEHLNAYIRRLRPADHVELRIVRKLASADWRQSRCSAIEARAFDMAAAQLESPYLEKSGDAYPNSVVRGLRRDVDNSKLPSFLAAREKDHDRTFDSGIRQLAALRKHFPLNENPVDSTQTEEEDDAGGTRNEPETNLPAVENIDITNLTES
jgi:hypothetical protein